MSDLSLDYPRCSEMLTEVIISHCSDLPRNREADLVGELLGESQHHFVFFMFGNVGK